MQIAFVVILMLTLLAASISFTVMGLRHSAHTRFLAQNAHKRGILFSREDPFDVPVRFGEFAIISCGHSPRAYNVMHGQLEHWPVRAFTFRYEVGHGTKRTTRHYGIVVVEFNNKLPDVIMWSTVVDDQAPLEVRNSVGNVLCWSFAGSKKVADAVAGSAIALGEKGLGIQIRGDLLMLSMLDTGSRQWDYTSWVDEVMAVPAALEASAERLTSQAG